MRRVGKAAASSARVARGWLCVAAGATRGVLTGRPSGIYKIIPSTPWEAPAGLRAAEQQGNEGKLIVSDTNLAIVVGVADTIQIGQHLGVEQLEFRLVTTNRRMSGDGRALVEKQAFRVVLLDAFARSGRTLVTPGAIVHVVGRLHFQPRFNAGTLAYDNAHEIVVSERCGWVTPLVREGAPPPERPAADAELVAMLEAINAGVMAPPLRVVKAEADGPVGGSAAGPAAAGVQATPKGDATAAAPNASPPVPVPAPRPPSPHSVPVEV